MANSKTKKTIAGIFGGLATFGGGVIVADNQINPYEDKDTHYELSVVSDIPQNDRVEIAKDKPSVTLSRWNDEERVTIEPKFRGAGKISKANRSLFSKKMEFKKGAVTAFVEPKTETEFDIDFTLDSKPTYNVFEYTITRAESMDFFYQPALTQEEIDEGASRPDNVVGSYAVYSKTKANHEIGKTNYGTGKLFHIYRPEAIDANGNKIWAVLDYKNGVLSVTVPQDFLDTATYPVRVDPTFGYTSAGGSTITTENSIKGSFFSIQPVITNATSITAYMNPTDSGRAFKFGVYGESASSLNFYTNGVTAEQTGVTGASWYTLAFLSAPTINSAFVPVAWASSGTGDVLISYDSGAEIGYSEGAIYGTFPDPIVTWDSAVAGGNKYSIYMTADISYYDVFSGDDGFCYSAGTAACFNGAGSNIRMGFRVGVNFGDTYAAFRFQGVQIPQGATITSAVFTYEANDTDASTDAVKVWAEAADDSAALVFTTGNANSPQGKTAGSNSVNWTLPNQTAGTQYDSPDISTVVQEVVDRAGWISGNDLTILIRNNGAIENHNADGYDATKDAKLTISFTEGGGAGANTPHTIIQGQVIINSQVIIP